MNNIFYDGTKLLSMKDANGKKPELYIVDGNRKAGKTFFFNRLLVNSFLKNGSRFLLLFRDSKPLSAASVAFFEDIKPVCFPNMTMTQTSIARGSIRILLLNEKVCGYAVSMRNVELIKRMAHMFVEVNNILMDELQPEDGVYNTNEVQQLLSIHNSVARGKGKMRRYVRVFLIGNSCSLINPYYVELGIHKMLRNDTKFLRGNGWIMEHHTNTYAMKAQEESGLVQAFSNNSYNDFSAKNIYLNDNLAFVEKVHGKSEYLATFIVDNKSYSCRVMTEMNIIYIDDKIDPSFPIRLVNNTKSHNVSTIMGSSTAPYIGMLKRNFNMGLVRFKNLMCKNAFLDLICSISSVYI